METTTLITLAWELHTLAWELHTLAWELHTLGFLEKEHRLLPGKKASGHTLCAEHLRSAGREACPALQVDQEPKARTSPRSRAASGTWFCGFRDLVLRLQGLGSAASGTWFCGFRDLVLRLQGLGLAAPKPSGRGRRGVPVLCDAAPVWRLRTVGGFVPLAASYRWRLRTVGGFVPLAASYLIARPYKKNEQSFIESFNRTVRGGCLGWTKYRAEELRIGPKNCRN